MYIHQVRLATIRKTSEFQCLTKVGFLAPLPLSHSCDGSLWVLGYRDVALLHLIIQGLHVAAVLSPLPKASLGTSTPNTHRGIRVTHEVVESGMEVMHFGSTPPDTTCHVAPAPCKGD